MGYAEDWKDLMFNLQCLNKGSAKRQFRQALKYSFGGLCAYCRKERATTLDHIRPKCKGGSSLRSNLLPSCRGCNHDKGSENWLVWYQRQEFYNLIAQELIEEWITNERIETEELETHDGLNDRAKVCTTACAI